MPTHPKLSLVLTIKDRTSFTLRWLTYADKISFPFKVIIADGGKDSNLEDILRQKSKFQNINYDYIRYPYDSTYAQYYGKTADALSRIETPFAVVGQDDDFFLTEGLQEAVEFLSKHEEYIAYNGRIDNFVIRPNTNVPYGKDVEFIKNPFDESIEENTSAERTWKHFSNYTHTLYSVYRTEVIRKNYETLCKYNFTDLILHELILSFLTVAQGIVKRKNHFYLLRQINPENSSCRGEHTKKGDYLDRMLIDTWSKEFNQFVNSIADIIAAEDKIGIEEARQLVKKGYRKYFISFLAQTVKELQRNPTFINKFKNIIKNLQSDNQLRKILRSGFHLYQNLIDDTPRPRPINPSSSLFQKIQPIYDFLTSVEKTDHKVN